jgi:hypothetical protein
MLPTGEINDSDEGEYYPEQNVRATYAEAKFAHNQPIIQGQAVQMEIEAKTGRVITHTHQRLNRQGDRLNGKRRAHRFARLGDRR